VTHFYWPSSPPQGRTAAWTFSEEGRAQAETEFWRSANRKEEQEQDALIAQGERRGQEERARKIKSLWHMASPEFRAKILIEMAKKGLPEGFTLVIGSNP
jgi:hypothetical protein